MGHFERFGINLEDESPDRAVVYETACIYSRINRQVSEYLKPFNLSPSKFNALMVIKHQGRVKGISQAEIGKRLIVTPSNMTRLLDRMGREGLIERNNHKNDRRVNLVKISAKGSALLDKVWPGYCAKLSRLGNFLSKTELKILSGLLYKWFDKLG